MQTKLKEANFFTLSQFLELSLLNCLQVTKFTNQNVETELLLRMYSNY